jgi:Domain of unknown function (DUF5979)
MRSGKSLRQFLVVALIFFASYASASLDSAAKASINAEIANNRLAVLIDRSVRITTVLLNGAAPASFAAQIYISCTSAERGTKNTFPALPNPGSYTLVTLNEHIGADCRTGAYVPTTPPPTGYLWAEPTISPTQFVVTSGVEQEVVVTHNLVPSDATIAVQINVASGLQITATLPLRLTCSKQGVSLFHLNTTVGAKHVPLLQRSPLGEAAAGANCSFWLDLSVSPLGYLWDQSAISSKSVTLAPGENVVTFDLTALPASEIVFTVIPSGISETAQWGFYGSMQCEKNAVLTNHSFSFSNGIKTSSIKVPRDTACTFLPSWPDLSSDSLIVGKSALGAITVLAVDPVQTIALPLPFVAAGHLFVKKSALGTNGTPTQAPPVHIVVSCPVAGNSIERAAFYDFNDVGSTKDLYYLPVGLGCSWKPRLLNGVLFASNASFYSYLADQSREFVIAAGDNVLDTKFVLRLSGGLAILITPSPALPSNATFFATYSCKLPQSVFYASVYPPFTGPAYSQQVSQGQSIRVENVPAGSVCDIEIAQFLPAPVGGDASTSPMVPSQSKITIQDGQITALTATSPTAPGVTAAVSFRIDDATYSQIALPVVNLSCIDTSGLVALYKGSAVIGAPMPVTHTFSNLPVGGVCSAVVSSSDTSGAFIAFVDNALTLPSTNGAFSAFDLKVVARPFRTLSVVVIESGNTSSQWSAYPTLVCTVGGVQSTPRDQSFALGSARSNFPASFSQGRAQFEFERVPEGAVCIGSLQLTDAALDKKVFIFRGPSQQIKIGLTGNLMELRTQQVPMTSFALTLSSVGIASGASTSVRTQCEIRGSGLESWSGTQSNVPVGGGATILNVPAGATCISSVAAADLPRLSNGLQWVNSSYTSTNFVPSASGDTSVSIVLKAVANADQANAIAVAVLSNDMRAALLVFVMMIGVFSTRRNERTRKGVRL